MVSHGHTIFALSSARGKSGVAVVRLSGPQAGTALDRLTGGRPRPRRASIRYLSDGEGMLDQALVLWFPGPHSFTGEDVAELQLHGSLATVDAVLRVLGNQPGHRLAEPGEFTRRALENERLDLAQVEGLSDLIEAETEAQRRQALRVLSGALGTRAASWRSKLVRAAALLEATIDFADEDVPADVRPEVRELVKDVNSDLQRESAGTGMAERIRDGFEVAIVGPPNVGKSTLLNALAGRDAAITSDIAGTTRDVGDVRMDLRRLPVTVLDTAGLREGRDEIEALGVAKARVRAEQADLRVILMECRAAVPAMEPQGDDILAVPKADICDGDFSAEAGTGLDWLVDAIGTRLESRASTAGLAIRERHRTAMRRATESLDRAAIQLESGADLTEIAAEEVRSAIRALDSLAGRVDVEHILDDIFANFCIGK
ncbi:MAG: tRNA uridine-5-carboxymethylaminomethyl(34) synthesis GTPase MnmE [Boseongicola sp. SB0664_bin_43]|uniref:tRNA modification GTPase MnmE n=1 Tax=Boseongicola sp. SB0664_bin_43 TaxID=2604844 RepID=A0A6B0Y1U1_9RHOB|nr:tRNA uridine-5-carboxymethylaminomethyl(34) synthesis GTPase MnmE [Boseongicola sp. SB0664_bin_43]